MELKQSFEKTLYAVGYADWGRYIARERIVANEEEKAIQSLFARNLGISFVKLEEHYEPVS